MESYQAVFRRKEMKYLLSPEQLEAWTGVMEAHMVPDAFAHSSISNLYYDTEDYFLIRRSLEKPEYKEKLWLRCYGPVFSDTPAFLEIKKKASGVVYKRRVSLPYDEGLQYLAGQGPRRQAQIFRELDWMRVAYPGLRPRMFLSYERGSWKGLEDENLRLTLDREILWRTHPLDLRGGAWGNPLLDPGQALMEIKITGAQPLWLARALSELEIFPVSYSKYGRAYEALMGETIILTEDRRYA